MKKWCKIIEKQKSYNNLNLNFAEKNKAVGRGVNSVKMKYMVAGRIRGRSSV